MRRTITGAQNLFVYALCGDSHAGFVNTSLRFLKAFTNADVLVVASRCAADIRHDQVVRIEVDNRYDDHQASILLKTNLHRLVGDRAGRCCYLDTDVVAVDSRIDSIFELKSGPVTFAADHGRMSGFSRWAVRCPCLAGDCDHLRQAIMSKFGVEVAEANWQHWNGGVFLFDSQSAGFMDTWHKYTLAIFDDRGWKTRDQGTLIATVWRQGLQYQPVLPRVYNYIVDAKHGVPDSKRSSLPVSGYYVDRSYSLDPGSRLPRPHFLHFINQSVGARGWKNWDEVEALLS
ncbi:MAG TPA: hypothetical protein VJX67_18015 [Blastocatellia bacterium]|nr:hypothetical protein [Blastocatellia bacterium]